MFETRSISEFLFFQWLLHIHIFCPVLDFCTYIIWPKSKQKIFYVSHLLYTHNKKVILQIIPNMHETKSVDTESSIMMMLSSCQHPKSFRFWSILDFRFLDEDAQTYNIMVLVSCTENIQWEFLVILTDFIMKRKI